jgi:hypothetical protein
MQNLFRLRLLSVDVHFCPAFLFAKPFCFCKVPLPLSYFAVFGSNTFQQSHSIPFAVEQNFEVKKHSQAAK